MKCARCKKKYDDKLPICPHCGEDSEKAPEKIPLRRRTAFTAVVSVLVAVTVASVICLGVFLVIRRVQKGHYDKGWSLLEKGKPLEAIVEFERAGTYSNARDLNELTYKYCLACQLMEDEDWKAAHDLLCDVRDIDKLFMDTAGKIHYIEHCPQSPVTFSLSQVQSASSAQVPIKNLLGNKIGGIDFLRGWSYSNHGRPDLVSSVTIQTGFTSGIVVSVDNDPQVKREGYGFIVPARGQHFAGATSSFNLDFAVTAVSTIQSPSLPNGGRGYPVFGSLTLTIAVSPK